MPHLQKPLSEFVLGVDVGQVNDPTAAVLIQAVEGELHVRHIERFRLGLAYPAIVKQIEKLRGAVPGCALVVDATGVGRPIVDSLRLGGTVIAVSITGSKKVCQQDDVWRVPKRELVWGVVTAMEAGRLVVAKKLPMASALVDELKNFAVSINGRGHAKFEAKSGHDDIVLALALAVWASGSHI